MPRKTYNKLVRDEIPEIIKKDGAEPTVKILNDEDFSAALKEKLIEEAKELQQAETKEEMVNELADIMEVTDALAAHLGVSQEEVNEAQRKKRKDRGGFEKRIFLEHVEE